MTKFALSHENTSKGIAVIHTVDKNMIIGPNVLETPDREDVTTDKETMDFIINEQMKVAENIKPSDVIAYFRGCARRPTRRFSGKKRYFHRKYSGSGGGTIARRDRRARNRRRPCEMGGRIRVEIQGG